MAYKIYRRFMRKFARFVFGFERCPMGYQKNYRKILLQAAEGIIFAASAFFFVITFICMS